MCLFSETGHWLRHMGKHASPSRVPFHDHVFHAMVFNLTTGPQPIGTCYHDWSHRNHGAKPILLSMSFFSQVIVMWQQSVTKVVLSVLVSLSLHPHTHPTLPPFPLEDLTKCRRAGALGRRLAPGRTGQQAPKVGGKEQWVGQARPWIWL